MRPLRIAFALAFPSALAPAALLFAGCADSTPQPRTSSHREYRPVMVIDYDGVKVDTQGRLLRREIELHGRPDEVAFVSVSEPWINPPGTDPPQGVFAYFQGINPPPLRVSEARLANRGDPMGELGPPVHRATGKPGAIYWIKIHGPVSAEIFDVSVGHYRESIGGGGWDATVTLDRASRRCIVSAPKRTWTNSPRPQTPQRRTLTRPPPPKSPAPPAPNSPADP